MNQASDLILANIVREKLATTPDLDVLTFVSVARDGRLTDEIRTYNQLWTNGQSIARGLIGEGMGGGEAFGLVMQNHPEFVDVMVGASISNTVFVPIDARTKGDKLQYMLDYAECKGVVVADYALANLTEILGGCPQIKWIWVLDTGLGIALPSDSHKATAVSDVLDAKGGEMVVRAINPADGMQMLYTSGTTGDPKAIMAPHARFGGIASLGPTIGLQADDRPYTGLSLTHANAQLITLGNVLKMGLRGVISVKFTKSRLWDITRAYGCTMFNLLGGMTTAIYSEPPKDNDKNNPVRYVLSAGMPAAIWDDFRERFDVGIYEFYGCAEGGLTLNAPGLGPVGSIGKAPPTMICEILNDSDEECGPGEPGEICFRNADNSLVEVEYYKNEKASADKGRGGWFRSGDVGHTDAEGWIYFDYRAGGGIRRNGDFVNSAFVEKAIAEVPGVADVFVYGVHMGHNTPGEKEVVAAVVAEAGFDPQLILTTCREKLESNFVPGFLQIVNEIPKTASEKPQERFLLEAFNPDADNIIVS